MADGASSAPAPAPAPVAARGRPTAAPGPIELADEKTVQTLATPDSFGAPLARLSPDGSAHALGTSIWHQHRTHPALPYPPLSSDLTIVNRAPVASAALGERP